MSTSPGGGSMESGAGPSVVRDTMEWPDDFQFGMTNFHIGLWKSRAHSSLSVMVNKYLKKFIVIVDCTKPAQRKKKKVQLYHKIAGSSPFQGSFPFKFDASRSSGSVLVYEMELSSIVGIDYRNLLCEDGRLVLEMRQVIKREFSSLNDVHMFYMPTPPPSPSARPGVDALKRFPSGRNGVTPSPFLGEAGTEPGGVVQLDTPLDYAHSDPMSEVSCSVSEDESVDKLWRLERRSFSSPELSTLLTMNTPSYTKMTPHLEAGRPEALEVDSPPDRPPVAAKRPPFHNPSQTPGGLSDLGYTPLSLRRRPTRLSGLNVMSPAWRTPMPAVHQTSGHLRRATVEKSLSHYDWLPAQRVGVAEQERSTTRRAGIWDVDDAGRFRLYVNEDAGGWGPETSCWPHPARWTLTSEVYHHRTVVLKFSNPVLPLALESIFGHDKRLLRLYESGLPSWAVFLPTYGLWYRPWMRTVTFYLFICISLFSLACGFYDLYKNVPFLQTMLRNLAGSMYYPIFEWLEQHTKVRLSIFLGYLFGKSPLFMAVVRLLTRGLDFLRMLLAPVTGMLSRPFIALWHVLDTIGDFLWAALAGPIMLLFQAGRQLVTFVVASVRFAGRCLQPLLVGIRAMVTEPLQLLSQMASVGLSFLKGFFAVLRHTLTPLVSLARSWAPGLKRSAALASQAAQAAKPAVQTAAATSRTGQYWKALILKVAYALKSILNVISYLCCTLDRHRKSLVLALLQTLYSARAKARRKLRGPFSAVATVWYYLLTVLAVATGLALLRQPTEVAEATDSESDEVVMEGDMPPPPPTPRKASPSPSRRSHSPSPSDQALGSQQHQMAGLRHRVRHSNALSYQPLMPLGRPPPALDGDTMVPLGRPSSARGSITRDAYPLHGQLRSSTPLRQRAASPLCQEELTDKPRASSAFRTERSSSAEYLRPARAPSAPLG